jgi:hypothetical protein
MKNNKKGAAEKDGSATAEDPGAAGRQIEKLGAAKGKKGDISDATKAKEKKVVAEATPDYEGSPRMGYTQNFGPARQGGYAKGAARVNSIMKGAAQTDEKSGRKKPDYSDYEEQQKRHGITTSTEPYVPPVDERSGTRFPGVRGGIRGSGTFLPSHQNYISKEDWENATDEQKDINQG